MKYTNIFGDTEVSGYSPDGLGDYYKITDAQNDHNYWQEKIVSALQGLSLAHTTDCQIIYGGAVTDGGSGTIDISAGLAMGKDASGNIRLVTIPALSSVALPSGWNDDRQIWVVGTYEDSLESSTRNHKLATTSYHYILEDNYLGNADNDDLFVDSDPNSVADTVVCWGSFKMNGTTFTADTGRSDSMGLSLQDTTINQYGIGTGGVVATSDFLLNIGTSSGVSNIFRQLQSGQASSQIGSKASDSNFYLTNTYSGALGDVAKSITIDSTGNVGLGTITPGVKLEVVGDFTAQDTTINQYGIGVNGGTATSATAIDVTGDAEFSGGIATGGNSTKLAWKVIEIGDWNMDITASVNVAHGLGANWIKIRSISVIIRNDDNDNYFNFESFNVAGAEILDQRITIDNTNITIVRDTDGYFDTAGCDSTSYNRGWVTIAYEI